MYTIMHTVRHVKLVQSLVLRNVYLLPNCDVIGGESIVSGHPLKISHVEVRVATHEHLHFFRSQHLKVNKQYSDVTRSTSDENVRSTIM